MSPTWWTSRTSKCMITLELGSCLSTSTSQVAQRSKQSRTLIWVETVTTKPMDCSRNRIQTSSTRSSQVIQVSKWDHSTSRPSSTSTKRSSECLKTPQDSTVIIQTLLWTVRCKTFRIQTPQLKCQCRSQECLVRTFLTTPTTLVLPCQSRGSEPRISLSNPSLSCLRQTVGWTKWIHSGWTHLIATTDQRWQ